MAKQHQPIPVAGYKPQDDDTIAMVNAMKQAEARLLADLDAIRTAGGDPRWLAIGRTQIEPGFMAVNRAIFKPEPEPVEVEED